MERFREELAQTFNPRFELLEHHIVNINARLATAADSTNVVVTSSHEDTATNRHVTASVPKEGPTTAAWDYTDLALPAGSFASTPALTNYGYECLLRRLDFRDFAQWAILSKLDTLANLRDCTLFCDHTFPQCYVGYVVRIGGTAKYISEEIDSLGGMGPDVEDLRIFEIEHFKPSLRMRIRTASGARSTTRPGLSTRLANCFCSDEARRRPDKSSSTQISTSSWMWLNPVSPCGSSYGLVTQY